jgi:predicted RNA-binding Zn-ribbon protein involved in translation (DUF1610 family)
MKKEQVMKRTVLLVTVGLVVGLVFPGCQTKGTLATSKDGGSVCCGMPMQKEGKLVEMKCPSCGKHAMMGVKCPACGKIMDVDLKTKMMKCPMCGKTEKMQMKCPGCEKMMKPTGRTMEMFRCNKCGKISITGGSIDTPG